MLTEKQAIEMLRRAQSQLRKWQEKYGEASPDWLPPAGDVRLLEDIDEAITSLEDDLHHFQEDNPYLKNAIRVALSEQSAPFITVDSVVKDDLITETLSDEDILRMSVECRLCNSYPEGKYVTDYGNAREIILNFARALLKA